jgi:hypothetical protein
MAKQSKKRKEVTPSKQLEQAEAKIKAEGAVTINHQQPKGEVKMEMITVPKDMGGALRNDLEGVCAATLTKLHWGVSQQKKPKVTIEFVLTQDIAGIEPPTTGEKVLENCSLQPQAMWKINDYYKKVTGEDIPAGDVSYDQFKQMMEEVLLSTDWDLDLQIAPDDKGNPRTGVRTANYLG